jgi:hypothetical protein
MMSGTMQGFVESPFSFRAGHRGHVIVHLVVPPPPCELLSVEAIRPTER